MYYGDTACYIFLASFLNKCMNYKVIEGEFDRWLTMYDQ